MLFPLLPPGGLYIIEDWPWSHFPQYQARDAWGHDEPALTNLIFDLAALQGSQPLWISSLTLHTSGGMAIIQKGYAEVPVPFELAAHTRLRGKSIGYI